MTLFEKCCDIDNIKSAVLSTCKGKQKKATKVKKFLTVNAGMIAKKIQGIILKGSWKPSELKYMYVIDKGKNREIILAPVYPDRIIHRLLTDQITDLLRKKFIRDTYQSLEGRGSHKAIKRIQRWLIEVYKDIDYETKGYYNDKRHLYYLQLDVKKFYQNINGAILYEKLEKVIYDKEVLRLLKLFIDECGGVYLGSSLSQILANFYLNNLDHFIKEKLRCRRYIRYCDDMVLFAEDKETLWKWYHLINKEVKGLRLTLHKPKVCKMTSGLDFLGYATYPHFTKTRRRIRMHYFKALKQHKVQSVASLSGWFKICTPHMRLPNLGLSLAA